MTRAGQELYLRVPDNPSGMVFFHVVTDSIEDGRIGASPFGVFGVSGSDIRSRQ